MDPYKILGISPNATDEEVKTAYRNLVKKYHPDRYTDSKLKEEANEKLTTINAAYEEIQRIRQGRGSNTNASGSTYSYNASAGSPQYAVVRAKIQMGDLFGAESILDSMSERDAEWHYWKGIVLLRKGWYDGARQHFATARNMDPSNRDYAAAYTSVNQFGSGFGRYYGDRQTVGDCSTCDICTGLLCLDMCCGNRCC